jgi:cobalt-zinc-cadmium efflux system outer membrane protein
MFRRLLPLLAFTAGCQSLPAEILRGVSETTTAAPAAPRLDMLPCATAAIASPSIPPLDLPALWSLALANNPTLREAAATVEEARGRQIQAGKYPNPRLLYDQSTIGSRLAQQGNMTLQANQEIVTAGKRRLDHAVAERETAAASAGLVGRTFETLTRVRRAYYEYLGLNYTLQMNRAAVETLDRGLEITRDQVERARSRPQTDLLRIEALLAEARINEARTRDELEGARRQLAAEVGVPTLPVCAVAGDLSVPPLWEHDPVLSRVLETNSAVRQANLEVERARLAVERARAEVVPNVTVGGGYSLDNLERTAGGLISVETSLPLWDRKQGQIHAARARLAATDAAAQGTITRLTRETAEAFVRYRAARRQVERLTSEVLPRLEQSLELLQKAYQAGSAQVTFTDVLSTEQSLNSTRSTLAEARRALWTAVADLQGLMQLALEDASPLAETCPIIPAP